MEMERDQMLKSYQEVYEEVDETRDWKTLARKFMRLQLPFYYVDFEIQRKPTGDVRRGLHKLEKIAQNLYQTPWKTELYRIKCHGALTMNFLKPALGNFPVILQILGYNKIDEEFVLDIKTEMEKDNCFRQPISEYLYNVFRDKVLKVAVDLFRLQLTEEPIMYTHPHLSKHSYHQNVTDKYGTYYDYTTYDQNHVSTISCLYGSQSKVTANDSSDKANVSARVGQRNSNESCTSIRSKRNTALGIDNNFLNCETKGKTNGVKGLQMLNKNNLTDMEIIGLQYPEDNSNLPITSIKNKHVNELLNHKKDQHNLTENIGQPMYGATDQDRELTTGSQVQHCDRKDEVDPSYAKNSQIQVGEVDTSYDKYTRITGGKVDISYGKNTMITGSEVDKSYSKNTMITGGEVDTSYGKNTQITGGEIHTSYGKNTRITGGKVDTSYGKNTRITGGEVDTSYSKNTMITGGEVDISYGKNTMITGGEVDISYGKNTRITGGEVDTSYGKNTRIKGGEVDTSYGNTAGITGGEVDISYGKNTMITGGKVDTSYGKNTMITGGEVHTSYGKNTRITGGELDTSYGKNTMITGGKVDTSYGKNTRITDGEVDITYGKNTRIKGGEVDTSYGKNTRITGDEVDLSYGKNTMIRPTGDEVGTLYGKNTRITGGEVDTSYGKNTRITGGEVDTSYGKNTRITGGEVDTSYGKNTRITGGEVDKSYGKNTRITGGEVDTSYQTSNYMSDRDVIWCGKYTGGYSDNTSKCTKERDKVNSSSSMLKLTDSKRATSHSSELFSSSLVDNPRQSSDGLNSTHCKASLAVYLTYNTTSNSDAIINVAKTHAKGVKQTATHVNSKKPITDVANNKCETCANVNGFNYQCKVCGQLHVLCIKCDSSLKKMKCPKGGKHQFTDFACETEV